MSCMFYICSSLINIDLSNFNTNNVTNMRDMFEGCSSLTKLQKTIDNIKTNLLKRDCIQFFKFGDNINEIVKNSLINIPDTMIDFFCQNNVLPKN